MGKIKVPYSYLEKAKKDVNDLMRKGFQDYQPVRLGWEEYQPLDVSHLIQDADGQYITDTSLPRVLLNWDPDKEEWVIDSDKYEVDTTR